MAHGPRVSGKWNDDSCQKDQSFVCSRKKCQSTSPSFTNNICFLLVTGITGRKTHVSNTQQLGLYSETSSASTPASSIDLPPPTRSPCPQGYTSWYRNCYKLVAAAATWDAAQTACEQQGGDLASIDMSYDQAFVAGVVLQGGADAWIGLRRKVKDIRAPQMYRV